MSNPVKIFEVLYHDDSNPHGAAFGDGSHIARFRGTKAGQSSAELFASSRRYFGKPAEAMARTVSSDLARRYGLG